MTSHGNQTKHLELYYYRILRHSILLYKRCIAIKIAKFILFCEGDLLHYRLLYFWNTFLLFMMRHSRFIVFFLQKTMSVFYRENFILILYSLLLGSYIFVGLRNGHIIQKWILFGSQYIFGQMVNSTKEIEENNNNTLFLIYAN